MKISLIMLTLLVGLASFSVGCGAPAGTGRGDDNGASSGDEDDGYDEDDDESITDGSWAPRASLARVEDIPRIGRVEERPSRTGAVRLIALFPIDGTGNRVLEIVGLPALSGEEVVASLRGSHDTPRWVGCNELIFVVDGEELPVGDAAHQGGVTTLGVQEAIEGRLPVAHLERVAAGTAVEIKSCEETWEVPRAAQHYADFVEAFRTLTIETDSATATETETGSETETETETETGSDSETGTSAGTSAGTDSE